MKKNQIRKVFFTALEMRLSIPFYCSLLGRLNRDKANKIKQLWRDGQISKYQCLDILVDCIYREIA